MKHPIVDSTNHDTGAAIDRGPVRIQVLSDLHLEFPRPSSTAPANSNDEDPHLNYDFPPRAEILALLGDIGPTAEDDTFCWLRKQLARFKLVLFLSGNHEPYNSSLEESNRRLVAFARECDELANKSPGENIGRFVLLDRTRYDITDTVTVLGCTLWSRLDPNNLRSIRLGLNDFNLIQDLTLKVYDSLHRRDISWLEQSIMQISRDEPQRTIVVMTHHAPTVEGTSNPRYSGGPIGSAFATELTDGPCWNERVKVWMFGHTHWVCDFERKGVRVLSNPRGYRNGQWGFDSSKIVEI